METIAQRATVALTQAQFNALSTKDINVQYLITDAEYLQIEYSADGTTWTSTVPVGVAYMRLSTDNGLTWSDALTTKGTDGIDGEMTGPASSTDGNFASFDGVDGTTLKDSGKKASDFAEAVHTHGYLANIVEDTTPELGGPLDCNNKLVYWDIYTISGTTIDVDNGNKQKITLSDTNITVSLSAPAGACAFHLYVYQGVTPRTITWPSMLWLSDTEPDLNVASGKFVVCLTWDGTNWFGSWGAYS